MLNFLNLALDGERCQNTVVDLVMIVDSSGSICGEDIQNCPNWEFIQSFLRMILDALEIGPQSAHVGLIRFASRADVIYQLDRYLANVPLVSASCIYGRYGFLERYLLYNIFINIVQYSLRHTASRYSALPINSYILQF